MMQLVLKMDFLGSGNTKKKILKISKKIQTKISKCQEPKRECDLVYYNKKHIPVDPDFPGFRPDLYKHLTQHIVFCSAYHFNHILRIKFTALFSKIKFSHRYLWYFIFRLFRKMGVPKFYRYMSERYPCLSQVSFDLTFDLVTEFLRL